MGAIVDVCIDCSLSIFFNGAAAKYSIVGAIAPSVKRVGKFA
jgi:hypothetical protein